MDSNSSPDISKIDQKFDYKLNIQNNDNIVIKPFQENDLYLMIDLCNQELSEPYSIYTYRHFLNDNDGLCFFAYYKNVFCGVVIGKISTKLKIKNLHNFPTFNHNGYIGMIVVHPKYRKLGIGKQLLDTIMEQFIQKKCVKVSLETESVNYTALNFYQKYGFIKVKKRIKYYMNGFDAYKLRLLLEEN